MKTLYVLDWLLSIFARVVSMVLMGFAAVVVPQILLAIRDYFRAKTKLYGDNDGD